VRLLACCFLRVIRFERLPVKLIHQQPRNSRGWVRNIEKAEDARTKILKAIPEASLEIIQLDLSDPTSVRSFSTIYRNSHKTLDILCNNAGIMMVPNRMETVDGFELQLGTNHFGHFALTGLLLDLITPVDGRVVTMSSLAHASGSIEFENLQWDKGPYSTTGAYGRSKLANLLFTYELHRRLAQSGSKVKALASHPGWSRTNLQSTGMNTGEKTILSRISGFGIGMLNPILAQSAHMGSLPMLYAATSTDAQSGEYYGPGGRGEMRGYPKKVTSNESSHDESVAKELWEVSEKLTGVSFPI